MSLFSRFFKTSARLPTVDRPFIIRDPAIGFLNLLGEAGARLLEADKQRLGPLFSRTGVSEKLPPARCDVLFIYGSLSQVAEDSRAIASTRPLINAARAYIAVFASDNDPDAIQTAYMERSGKHADWGANIVMTLDRRDDKFAAFFHDLFKAMFEGETMPTAWLRLQRDDGPSLIFAAEIGHVTLHR
jgi:hypothetical protein